MSRVCVILCLAVAFTASLAAQTPVAVAAGRNWLVNPGAEDQPVTASGWKQVSGDWTRLKPGTDAHTGRAFFWGGQSARAELSQQIPLKEHAGRLADGRATASFVGYLGSWKDDADSAAVYLEALDDRGTVLAGATTGARNNDTWTRESLRLTLPANAASIRVRLLATRVAGNDNNGYFDDLELRLAASDGRPLDSPDALSTVLPKVLELDFDNDTLDRSPAPPDAMQADGVAFQTLADGSTVGVFDGRGSTLSLRYSQPAVLQRFTILVRLSSSFTKPWQAILDNRGWDEGDMHFQFADRSLELAFVSNQPTNVRPDTLFQPDTWYDIAATYDAPAGRAVLYANGQRIAEASYTARADWVMSDLMIGGWDGGERSFAGYIDFLYVLSGVMSAEEVLGAYQSSPQPPAVAAPRAPAALADRPAPAQAIQTYYGLYQTQGRLEMRDGVRNGTYTDTYQYEARAGERIAIQAWPQSRLALVLTVVGPGGQVVPSGEIASARAGVYTLYLSAEDPSDLADGLYWLTVAGGGHEIRGKLDPFSDSRDSTSLFETVDLSPERAGYYNLRLVTTGFRAPRLVLRDKDYRDVAETHATGGGGQGEPAVDSLEVRTLLSAGTYHAVIEDELTGGDWTLSVTYLGEGGS